MPPPPPPPSPQRIGVQQPGASPSAFLRISGVGFYLDNVDCRPFATCILCKLQKALKASLKLILDDQGSRLDHLDLGKRVIFQLNDFSQPSYILTKVSLLDHF